MLDNYQNRLLKAVQKGEFDVVKWLFEHKGVIPTYKTLSYAIHVKKNYPIASYLYAKLIGRN